MNVSYIAHVKGKVQGVFFRASSQQQAIEYGLSGYARNLADGEVEVLVCGEENNVNRMLEWLNHGPPQAEVEEVKAHKVAWQDHNHFSIS
jgi:acylphosphatase